MRYLLIPLFAAACNSHDLTDLAAATPADVGLLIHAHPTLSELFGESVLALTGRSLHG